MTTDLEPRLRRYGPVLDTATALVEGSIRPVATPVRRRRARGGLALLVAAATAAAAIAGLFVVRSRSNGDRNVTSSPPGGQVEPVVLDDGLVPWYEVDPLAVEGAEPHTGLAAGSTRLDGGQQALACTQWRVDNDTVTCQEIMMDGFRPTQTFTYDPFRWVSISTIHREGYSAMQYSSDWTYHSDYAYLGFADSPYVSEQITINDNDASYTSTDNSSDGDLGIVRRVTFAVGANTFVAVETKGFTRDELLAFAASVHPTETKPAIDLVLADAGIDPPPGHRRYRLLGDVRNGEVCVYPQDHIVTDTADPCDIPTDPLTVYASDPLGIRGLYLGAATAGVDTIRFDFTDGTQLTFRPPEQPIGEVRPFAVMYPSARGETITALDADGNEIATLEAADINPTATPATTEA